MATGISSESFIKVVKRSGVVSDEELTRALALLEQRTDIPLEDSGALATALIEQGTITRWQADKLLQGKHKGFFLGQYRLLGMLGRGGMGAVYLAEHKMLRRRCAIKVLPAKNLNSRSYLERFYREAQAVAAMDHKNIVRAYDVNHDKVGVEEVHYLAMEYVEGRDLQKVVDEDGPLAYNQAAEYVRQAAEGLSHAHEAGMVHRDIKPANLLLNNKGIVKILDLGLAKLIVDQNEAASLTVAHNETVLGTADYLSPEQAVDSHNTDHRADIYSLGCTLYYLLTGHPPFCEGSVASRLLSHQIKPPPPIRNERPDAPDSLIVIVDRMMAKKREERYQSGKEISDDLAVWLVENGNEEWRERNPELVRKVGESWRADTKVVSGSLVDTAELDLKDELSLAPLEGVQTPKESPLVSEAPAEKPKAARPGSGLELASQKTDIKSKASSQSSPKIKPAETKQAPAAPAKPAAPRPNLVADLPDLAPLDELQPLDILGANSPTTNSGGFAQANVSSAGGLAAAPQSAAQKSTKAESGLAIPMPVMIVVGALAVLTVITVIVMMVVHKKDQVTELPPTQPGATAPVAPQPGPAQVATAPAVNSNANVQPPAAITPPKAAAPQNTAANNPPTLHVEPAPPAVSPAPPTEAVPTETAPNSQGQPTNPPPANFNPNSTPGNVTPPAPQENPTSVPAPAPTQQQTASPSTTSNPPSEASDTPPTLAPPLDENAKRALWQSFDSVAFQPDIPPELKSAQGLVARVEDIFNKDVREKGLKLDSDSPAVLNVIYRLQAAPDSAGFFYTVEVRLVVKGANGQSVDLWTDKGPSDPVKANTPKTLIDGLRGESVKLVSRMLNARKDVLGIR